MVSYSFILSILGIELILFKIVRICIETGFVGLVRMNRMDIIGFVNPVQKIR